MIGKQGRVTGKIGPGLTGEVMIEVRGGVEAFYAFPQIPDQQFGIGALVIVVEYLPPRTVYVAPAMV